MPMRVWMQMWMRMASMMTGERRVFWCRGDRFVVVAVRFVGFAGPVYASLDRVSGRLTRGCCSGPN
jgi:hypothetical protein